MPDSYIRRLDALAINRVTRGGTVWRTWGSGPRLLLLHGSAGSWTHWLHNIEALAAAHTVHVPDLPGFGDSQLPASALTMEALASMVLDGMEMIAADAAFDVAGFSFGSVLAESIALARPERVRRLVLVRGRFDGRNPAPPPGLVRWRGLPTADQRAAAHRHNLAAMMFHDAALIDPQAVHLHEQNAERAMLDLASVLASRPVNALAATAAPILAIAGEFDCFTADARANQESALLAANPKAHMQVIKDAGHWVNYEAAPAFNRVMRDWLNRDA